MKLPELRKDDGMWMLHFSPNCFVYLENDWRQLWGKYNWKTYRLADIYYEDDKMLGGHVIQVVILGFGFHFRKNNPDHPGMKELDALAEEARSSVKQPPVEN